MCYTNKFLLYFNIVKAKTMTWSPSQRRVLTWKWRLSMLVMQKNGVLDQIMMLDVQLKDHDIDWNSEMSKCSVDEWKLWLGGGKKEKKKPAFRQRCLDLSSGHREIFFKECMAIIFIMAVITQSGPKWWNDRQNDRHCNLQYQFLAQSKNTKAIIHSPLGMLLNPDGTFHFINVEPLY